MDILQEIRRVIRLEGQAIAHLEESIGLPFEEAAKMFGPAAKTAIERTVKELQELRRQQASSIVVPQGGLPPMPPGGGGKIQMP